MKKNKNKTSIMDILENYWNQLLALSACTNLYIPVAGRLQKKSREDYIKKIKKLANKLKSRTKKNRDDAEIELRKVRREYQPWLIGGHTDILARSTFLYIFSEYDALLGKLLKYIYKDKKYFQKKIEKTFT